MKTFISFLLALLVQGLFAIGVNAATTTINITSVDQAPAIPVLQGSIVPMLKVVSSSSGSGKDAWYYLVVKQTGSATMGYTDTTIIKGLYSGYGGKWISSGPFDCPNYSTEISGNPLNGTAIVGPIWVGAGMTLDATVCASFASNLSGLHGMDIGLNIVGVMVDSEGTESGDDVVFNANFPIRGHLHTINTNTVASSIQITNTTLAGTVLRNTQMLLAQFSVDVQREMDIRIDSFTHILSAGNSEEIRSVVVVKDGLAILGPVDISPADNTNAGYATFLTNVTFTAGHHKVELLGIVGNQIPDETTLHVDWTWQGEAMMDLQGYIVLPTIDNAPNSGRNVTIRSSYPTFTFTRNLMVGSTGYDVSVLQRILGMPSTGYFGPLTEAAVKTFQTEHNIPSTGFVGPLTRAVLNSMDMSPYLRPCVSITKVASGVTMLVSGPPATAFTVQGSADLRVWTSVSLVTTDESGIASMTQTASSPVQFFRLATP
jgi:hypothetical protein